MLDVEAEWHGLDLSADGVPALEKTAGGPFDIVTPHLRRLSQARRQLFLTHGNDRDVPSSKSTRRTEHEVLALVLWPAAGAGARAHEDQAVLGEAVAAVVARVHGPAGDIGHGNRWFRTGPTSVEPAGPLETLRFADAIGSAGAAYTVIVRYSVAEMTDR